MKIALALLFSVAVLAPSSGNEKPAAGDAVAASIGLEIGQRVPEFALGDQLGHEQSNETLKGSKGTIILFFRQRTGDRSAKRSSCSCKTRKQSSSNRASSWPPLATIARLFSRNLRGDIRSSFRCWRIRSLGSFAVSKSLMKKRKV